MKRRIDLADEFLFIFDTLSDEKINRLAVVLREYIEEKVNEAKDDLVDQIEKRGIYDPDY